MRRRTRATALPRWSRLALALPVLLLAAGWAARRWRQHSLARAQAALADPGGAIATARSQPSRSDGLPAPVARYLALVLPADLHGLRIARHEQAGQLRTDPRSSRWMDFTATQITRPAITEFEWTARVRAAPGVHLQVRDAFLGGHGAGQVLLWSTLPLGRAGAGPELDSGALHRFLAEAVWYPTALLPSPRLSWAPVDDRRAIATLRQGDTVVSLEFRFDEHDEVSGIYTPGRWGSFDGSYKQLPWEGHFGDYHEAHGVRVPRWGEVGWYRDGEWGCVWRGRVTRSELVFG